MAPASRHLGRFADALVSTSEAVLLWQRVAIRLRPGTRRAAPEEREWPVKFLIITVGTPAREGHRRRIREAMSGFEEVGVECVDGKNPEQLQANVDRHGFAIHFDTWRPGEGGLWYSAINAWSLCRDLGEPLLVFEDDALVSPSFGQAVRNAEPPGDFDFATYYVPYRSAAQASEFAFEAVRQEHGTVCIAYSPAGATRILDLLSSEGLDAPIDIWLFRKGLSGRLRGYGPSPTSEVVVDVDLRTPSLIHEDPRVPVTAPRPR
jgi:GR25 family glycosyltransferase involved in LPS biosynthesis